jgi:hypothetical protein
MKEAKRSRKRIAIEAVAYHEAGHAVLAWRRFVRLKGITIIPGKDFQGQCRHAKVLLGRSPEIEDSPRAQIRKQTNAMIALAGPIAQKLYKPRSFRHYHASSDNGIVADLALNHNGSSIKAAEAWIRWLDVCVRDIVRGNWPLVTALATELVRRKTLRGDEVEGFLRAESLKIAKARFG